MALWLFYSARRDVKVFGNNCNPTTYCCQGWPAIKTPAISSRKAFQGLYRSDAIYCSERRAVGTFQGHCSTNFEGCTRARNFDDDKRTVCTSDPIIMSMCWFRKALNCFSSFSSATLGNWSPNNFRRQQIWQLRRQSRFYLWSRSHRW